MSRMNFVTLSALERQVVAMPTALIAHAFARKIRKIAGHYTSA